MTDSPQCQDDIYPASRSCTRGLDVPKVFEGRPQSCPKLGDFTSLRSAATDFRPSHHILSHQPPSRSIAQLGDFSRVVNQLRAMEVAPKEADDATSKDTRVDSLSRAVFTSNNPVSSGLSETQSSCNEEKTSSNSAPASSMCSAAMKEFSGSSKVSLQRSVSAMEQRAPRTVLARPKKSSSHLTCILSYELSDKALIIPIFDAAQTPEGAHQSLSKNLIPYCTADCHLAQKFPSNTLHGVHVFLDMSNIEISFQKALKKRYNVADEARFSPLPRLNLQFLTELLVRGRSTRGMHVGCSILPGRREPKYVQDLRNLGYQVDVRERKRIDNGFPDTSQGKSSAGVGSKPVSRYVEDLVDETLQTRIAEAVMEYFQEQGTIVLATGDAKPAQYSDGFFRYVERALRMGWNVEVVAWHGSLSYSWKDADWTATWGERFRVIELDGFLYDLLEVQL
ncbi:hypothetical protein NLG97_g2049 [Lecanicillium saksenae]|uniref:Uncharacterized protein n=1 Tax=Lecanicillium saksenae TaxID=468837 RepID=A0ACC1R3W2_9HYPO|nr:hypothetical protein NLG97_g2049 [Lecanicillium saksenae]